MAGDSDRRHRTTQTQDNADEQSLEVEDDAHLNLHWPIYIYIVASRLGGLCSFFPGSQPLVVESTQMHFSTPFNKTNNFYGKEQPSVSLSESA